MSEATQEPNQVEYAGEVAEALNLCDDYNLTGGDILDALASTGLKLIRDDQGDAVVAYHSQFMQDG